MVNEHGMISRGEGPFKSHHREIVLLKQYVIVWIISDILAVTVNMKRIPGILNLPSISNLRSQVLIKELVYKLLDLLIIVSRVFDLEMFLQ